MPLTEIVVLLLIGAALGTALGALGGGGGILAIPLLIHVAGQTVDQATTTSLVVVAIGAAAGLIPHTLAGRVDWRSGFLFGALGVVGSAFGARMALVADDRLQLAGIFALMLLAASALVRNADESSATAMRHRVPATPGTPLDTGQVIPPAAPAPVRQPDDGAAVATKVAESPAGAAGDYSWFRLIVAATLTGLITGFFGVGGGFVAVPALIFGLRLPVKTATATGLLVIVINSVVALIARGHEMLDPGPTLVISAATVVAAVAGAVLSRRWSAQVTRKAFGYVLFAMAAWELYALATLG